MRIKLDENLPAGLAVALSALGHDADTVGQEGMQGRADPAVWRAAQQAGRFFITVAILCHRVAPVGWEGDCAKCWHGS